MDDHELLRQYVHDGSREALDALVRRHINLVWSTALRETRDPHDAADVTQAVFIVLMHRATHLSEKVVIGGWLFKVTRFAAADARKRRARRQRHEQEAASMRSAETFDTQGEPADPTARQAMPLLNDAIASLPRADRDAVLLKFIEQKSHAEIAQVMGIAENTARQRLFRAIGKLRQYFGRRGLNVSDSAMGGVLVGWSGHFAPPELADAVISILHTGPAGASAAIAKGAINMMRWNRIKLAASIVLPTVTVSLMVGVALVKAAEPPHQVAAATQPASQPVALGPREVVMLAYRSALKGDAKALIDCFDQADQEQIALLKQVADVFGALQELNSAVAEKFGPEVADKMSGSFAMSVDPKEMHNSAETITGDTAVVDIGKSGPGKITLVKIGGSWKISSGLLQSMNRQTAARTQQMIPAIQSLAADVRDDKYKTAQDLQRAMEQMMRQMRGQQR
jgi:RNA polymerase sigma factor (sigma-70 family)